jgi:hypothetical protein
VSESLSRLLPTDQMNDVVSMALLVYSIPRVIERVDALEALYGLGEDWRIKDAINWWETKTTRAKSLLLAITNPAEKTSRVLSMSVLQQEPFHLTRLEGVHIGDRGNGTKEQAEWTLETVQRFNIESIALFVSPYHCLRAYLTVLKTLLVAGVCIPLIPAPTPIAPDRYIPEVDVDAWQLVPGEVERIAKYQKQGDVATLEELKEYLSWLWRQPILADKELYD